MPETRYVALLRGINVGGNRKVPMKDLVRVVEGCGCSNAATLIQSGNAVFSSTLAEEPLRDKLEAAIEAEFGFAVPVVLRTRQQMDALIAAMPFADGEARDNALLVMFLRDSPTAERVAALDPARSPKDVFHVAGDNIFVHYAGGVAESKLNNQYFDSRLKTVATARNWATVKRLRELMG